MQKARKLKGIIYPKALSAIIMALFVEKLL